MSRSPLDGGDPWHTLGSISFGSGSWPLVPCPLPYLGPNTQHQIHTGCTACCVDMTYAFRPSATDVCRRGY